LIGSDFLVRACVSSVLQQFSPCKQNAWGTDFARIWNLLSRRNGTDRIRIHAAKQSGQNAALFVNFQSQHRWWLQLALEEKI
jgi:hypothetical protein